MDKEGKKGCKTRCRCRLLSSLPLPPPRAPARGERNETKPGPDDDARQGTLTVPRWVLENPRVADGPHRGERAGRRHDVRCMTCIRHGPRPGAGAAVETSQKERARTHAAQTREALPALGVEASSYVVYSVSWECNALYCIYRAWDDDDGE